MRPLRNKVDAEKICTDSKGDNDERMHEIKNEEQENEKRTSKLPYWECEVDEASSRYAGEERSVIA